MKVLNSSLLLIFVSVISGGDADEAQDGNEVDKGNKQDLVKADSLERFFTLQGFAIDKRNQAFVNRFNDETMRMISDLLQVEDGYQVSILNGQINSAIYTSELEKVVSANGDDDPKYGASLRALDLIVPDQDKRTKYDPVYELAKEDLLAFYREEKDLCKKLLDRVIGPLNSKELRTDEAAALLRHFYYHWIPLSHLKKFIESNGAQGTG